MWIKCPCGEVLIKQDHAESEPVRLPTGRWVHVIESMEKVFIDGEGNQDAKA